MDELAQAVEAVVRRCLGVAAGERVVVVADSRTRAIGEALREAASRAGAEAVLTLMDPREVDDSAHFTCPRGSDFTLDLSGRTGRSDDGDTRVIEGGRFLL
jgi:leucyl aminopeptidase (aminopeptidase T)